MNLIDTHSHIYVEDYAEDIDSIIESARNNQISHIIMPNIDVDTVPLLNKTASKFPGFCIPLMGLHPTSVTENYKEDLQFLKAEFSKQKYIGVGEIGIDLYWDKSKLKEQEDAFRIQINWAIEYNLPIIIHIRDSFRETMNILSEFDNTKISGIFHSFCGSLEEANEMLIYPNFLFGINGIVTFKNSGLGEVVAKIPIEKIVLETDSPYLTPAPHRGKRNHPTYLHLIAKKLSEIYNLDVETVATITTKNAYQLFGDALEND
ncbi:MAG: TatD family hydrolase [Bacteroidales bacterium]|nr:TatD family hydrolase [Bacteroidales bacterium]